VSRVLLTGASGFIGRHAVEVLLEEGQEVHAVARHPGPPREGVVWHEADLLQQGPAEAILSEVRAERLLHLAWYAVPGSFWSAKENELWIDASLRLLRAFGETGGRRAVIAGTCAEYAWHDQLLREGDSPLEPATLYGKCKHATHLAAAVLAGEVGVSLAWGRIFFLYGPGELPGRLVSDLARGLLAGEDVRTTDGRQRRDFMHVGDVAGAFAAVLAADVTGAVNICSGEAVPVGEIVRILAEEAGGLERVHFGELPRRPGEPALIAGDPGRLTGEVGFHPQFALRQGIRETVAWWRTVIDAPDADRGRKDAR
jgi:nucleoside-diphosphate-sugar epimerase